MTTLPPKHGWERLPCGCDLELRHGIPVRVSYPGKAPEMPEAALAGEIEAHTGLQVSVGEWLSGEDAGELQARVQVNSEQFTEVLNRLALSAAALFFDRYHKPIAGDDVDWDTLEFANDYTRALEYCGMDWSDIERDKCRADYLKTMHTETRRLATSTEPPLVEPETD